MTSGETVRQYNGHHKGLFSILPVSLSETRHLKLPSAVPYTMVRVKLLS